jgi:hypothetical protein
MDYERSAEQELFVSAKDKVLFENINRTLEDYYMSLEDSFRCTLDHELADGFISQSEYDERMSAYHKGLFNS